MRKWEYQLINLSDYPYGIWEQTLTIQGGLGWELVSVDGYHVFFKREVKDADTTVQGPKVESEELNLLKQIKGKLDRCLG